MCILGFKVPVADTVGSGDAFTAGLVHEYLHGASLDGMNQVANRVGAWVASEVGAMPTPRRGAWSIRWSRFDKAARRAGLRYSTKYFFFFRYTMGITRGTIMRTRTGASLASSSVFFLGIILAGLTGTLLSCSKPVQPTKAVPSKPSDIKVEVRDGGPIVIRTATAEFQILPSGYVHAALEKDGKPLTLDEPVVGSTGGSDSIVLEGKEFDFIPDFSQAKVVEATGKLGRGKRVEGYRRIPWRLLEWRSTECWWCRRTTISRISRWSVRPTKM